MSDKYQIPEYAVAVIAMSGRFPGAGNVDQLWSNLCGGVEAISFFDRDALLEAGQPASLVDDPQYVPAAAVLDGIEDFDAAFFGFSPREAELLDPQQRLFLEASTAVLERAGYGSGSRSRGGRIGVYAGSGMSSYLYENLLTRPDLLDQVGPFQALIANDKDFLSTRVSYKLDLRGPSVTVQTACSTSLVAAALACQALIDGECDMAIAGGVTVRLPHRAGYLYQQEGILSPDGHCRAFDADAAGTVPGSGVGVVLLKPLARAMSDGDWIHAVIRGWALNNDGAAKVGYSAPSVDGQAAVITEALEIAGVDPATIGYVETHGTGTRMGDPIEIAALTRAFGEAGGRPGSCALGSLKTNLGHLDNAAGVAGLIKASLAVEQGKIPPSLHFSRPNPEIDFDNGPFRVAAELVPWSDGSSPRRAGVSSFGIGGTNAHLILEEPPPRPAAARTGWSLLTVSARDPEALDRACAELAEHLEGQSGHELDDTAYTLQVGRRSFDHRRIVVADSREAAISDLKAPVRGTTSQVESEPPTVAFLFPGQGAQHPGMAGELHRTSETFRRELDACIEILQPLLAPDLRSLLCGGEPEPAAAESLTATSIAQPALFAVEYALARAWMELGVEPAMMLGHSIGEYVAACLSGVFSLEDALAVVAARGRLVQEQPSGAMLAVPLPPEELADLVNGQLAVAAINGPRQCTVSGPNEEIARLEGGLARRSVATRRLHTSHAFHSPMMAAAAEALRRELQKVELRAPRIPFISNVTGSPIRAEEARDPDYWARHLLEPVRFRDGAAALLQDPQRLLLEVGPGDTLTSLARQAGGARGRTLIASMPHPGAGRSGRESFLAAAGRLWLAGVPMAWEELHQGDGRRRVPLPTSPFQRARHWVEPGEERAGGRRRGRIYKRPAMDEWFYIPTWRRTGPAAQASPGEEQEEARPWLVLGDGRGLGARLADRLRRSGSTVFLASNGSATSGDDQQLVFDPENESAYDAMLHAVHERAGIPGHVVDLLPLDDTDGTQAFCHLLFLARALSRQARGQQIGIMVAGRGLNEVTGGDAASPASAAVLGLSLVISQEYPHLGCRVVDLPPDGDGEADRDAATLLAELRAAGDESMVAYRGGHRWLQGFEPLDQAGAVEEPPPWAGAGDHVLITGGLGRFGLAMAEHLAGTRESIALTLVDVVQPPDPGAESDPRSAALARIRALGARLWVATADVADREAMKDLVEEARRRHGRITGILHAAGFAGADSYRTLEDSDRALAESHLRPKVEGLRVLVDLLARDEPELGLVASSLAPILGGIGLGAFAAADSSMDALVHWLRGRGGTAWRSVNWEGWEDVIVADGVDLLGQQQQALMMTTSEVAAACERIAAAPPVPSTVVATGDLEARIAQWTHVLGGARDPAAGGARSASAAFTAPRDEIEERIAAIWEAALGVDAIGIDDDFFELGGNSLIGLQILSRMRGEFQAELPLRSFFEARTVAGMAQVIAAEQASGHDRYERITAILDEIESLSDQEAEARLGVVEEAGPAARDREVTS